MFDDAKRSMVRRLGAVASSKVTIVFSQCVQNLPDCSPYCSYSRCKKKVPIHINPILYPKEKEIVKWHIFPQSPPFQWQVQLSSAAVAILERMPLGSCWELLVIQKEFPDVILNDISHESFQDVEELHSL
jgi:hypothetical protein